MDEHERGRPDQHHPEYGTNADDGEDDEELAQREFHPHGASILRAHSPRPSRLAPSGDTCRTSPKLSSTDRWPSPVEGAALEMPYSRKAVLGSNPNLSATQATAGASNGLSDRSAGRELR